MPSDTGQGTESYTWDTETEWNNGTFTQTTTDGNGNLTIAQEQFIDFPYILDREDGHDLLVEIRDAGSGTVLASDSASGDGTTINGTFTIDAVAHPDLEFYAEVVDSFGGTNNPTGSAEIQDRNNTTIVIASGISNGTGTFTDTATQNWVRYYASASYQTETWDFTNTTTATKLTWSGVTYPNTGDDITVTVSTADATSQTSVPLSSGSGSQLVEVGASDAYYLDVSMSTADTTTRPDVGSLSLETHTPPTGLQITATGSTSVDLSWSGVSVSDGYEVYQKQGTGVGAGDTLAFDTTASGTTSASITGLEEGEQYSFNVRSQYTGE